MSGGGVRPWAGLLAVLTLAGCTGHPKPGTGDLAFRVVWQGIADVDLHVLDPDTSALYFDRKTAPSGGVLDVDCNSGTDRMCDRPIENVFWPTGQAPDGLYDYEASLFQDFGQGEIEVTLQVLVGGRPVRTHKGRLSKAHPQLGPFDYIYRRAGRRAGSS
jgi:hypothetical protein